MVPRLAKMGVFPHLGKYIRISHFRDTLLWMDRERDRLVDRDVQTPHSAFNPLLSIGSVYKVENASFHTNSTERLFRSSAFTRRRQSL